MHTAKPWTVAAVDCRCPEKLNLINRIFPICWKRKYLDNEQTFETDISVIGSPWRWHPASHFLFKSVDSWWRNYKIRQKVRFWCKIILRHIVSQEEPLSLPSPFAHFHNFTGLKRKKIWPQSETSTVPRPGLLLQEGALKICSEIKLDSVTVGHFSSHTPIWGTWRRELFRPYAPATCCHATQVGLCGRGY